VLRSDFLDQSTSLLARTPGLLRGLLLDLPEPWLDVPDTEGGWTARDVVGHLVSAELDNWIPRVTVILSDEPTRSFEPFDRVAHVQRDRGVPLSILLEQFSDLRDRSVESLAGLVKDEADLERTGIHPELGEVTLRQLIATWTVHDLDHVAQVFASLARYPAAPGPVGCSSSPEVLSEQNHRRCREVREP
jgi:uncharacterized damage-inducible protein DinB